MTEILYTLAWSLCPGLLVGLLEHPGALQLLPQHEDALFKRSFTQWGQAGEFLGFFSPGGWDSFSHIFFLGLDGSPHIT